MRRVEGLRKLTGRESYVDDVPLEDFLWGATVRSPCPRGRITEIRFGAGIDWSEFVVVDPRDIPGRNCVYLMEEDQPVLADGIVRHVHEPVLLLAHPSREALRRAAGEIQIEVDPLPPALDFRVPPDPDRIQFGEDNVLSHIVIDKGDAERALAGAPHVVEGVYETGAQEHVYLENQGMIAWPEGGGIAVRGSLQCPYYIVEAFRRALDLEPEAIRVIQAATGGGFGGKEEYPSMIALHAALLALKAGRAVKLVYERGEDMRSTTKRHPSLVRHRTGVDGDGHLIAQIVDLRLDGGAYVTLSPVVLSRAVIHAAGPYACDHVHIDGRAMFTNRVPFGAFRGFGAPQALFAVERHMDVIAATLGLDPVDVRRRNLIRDGQETATGQVIRDGSDRVALLDRALELASWETRRQEHEAFNESQPVLRRGLGVSTFYHGAGFTGAGEVHLASVAAVEGRPDGGVEILTSSVEMGQGTETVFTQLAANRLGLDPARVHVVRPDTRRVPDSGPTVASRTTMVVGRLVERACDDLRARLGVGETVRGEALAEAIRACHERSGAPPRGEGRYEPPPGIHWDEEAYRGDAYGAFGWGAYVAEVEVDLRTYTARVTDFVAVQDVGNVINETLARGQIQGGVVQGIGWALLEECRWRDGAMENDGLTNYLIPTSDDVPPIRVDFVGTPYPHGAGGAKGLGELPMDGPGPAIAGAVAAATGCDPRVLPITPERLMEMMEGGESAG
ncbi:MAG: xanthine dehydrogenase family protein molybdopterin-binding subunit [Gemmatimonadota bacterium]